MNRFCFGLLAALAIVTAASAQNARPVVLELRAWVSPPAFFPRKANGEPYRKPQPRGDIYAIPGSTARVWIRTEKPIANAIVELLGSPTETDDPEVVMGKVTLTVKNGNLAEGTFPLELFRDARMAQHEPTRYRIIVTDDRGVRNVPSMRRTIALRPEDSPSVRLTPTSFGPGTDFEPDDMPVVVGEKIRVSYVCNSPHGIGGASLFYRIVKEGSVAKARGDAESFIRLALPEVEETKASGPFDPMTGAFMNTKFDVEVPFHAAARSLADEEPGRTFGGGRKFLPLNGLLGKDGKVAKITPGDQIEYYIEVLGRHRQPASAIPVGRSERKAVNVVTQAEFLAWYHNISKEADRIRELELRQKQKSLFKPK